MKPIYEPKGAAKEYGDYAINIYTGCPHGCFYCFAPSVLRRDREAFHTEVRPRENIVEETRKQIEREGITGRMIHLCFTCDPYPKGYDTTPTREIIRVLKESGNHVQILTKNGKDAMRDFDLLDSGDWFGITYAGYEVGTMEEVPESEPNAGTPRERLSALADYVNLWKVGKLNYYPSDIDWKEFGERVECWLRAKKRNRLDFDYYIKDSLRVEMEKPR